MSSTKSILLEGAHLISFNFVRKPVDFNDFGETVARLGVYWLATNAGPCR